MSHVVLFVILFVGFWGAIICLHLLGIFREETPAKQATLPTEQECIELAHVVISARGIEGMEVHARARRLLEAVAARKYSQLRLLRAEFINELVQHQAIYGQLVPPKAERQKRP